jgi:hypothetical protein
MHGVSLPQDFQIANGKFAGRAWFILHMNGAETPIFQANVGVDELCTHGWNKG